MRPSHGVVGAWAGGLLVLALVLLVFVRQLAVFVMFLGWIGVVALFGLAVLLAGRRSGEHTVQRRQPRRATAAVFVALGLGTAATGLAYGWVLPLLAIYPLGLGLWLLRGERLPAGTEAWPVAADGTPPADPAPFSYQGQALGTSDQVPDDHPAHAAPPDRAYPTRADRARPLTVVAKLRWTVLTARVMARLMRRRG